MVAHAWTGRCEKGSRLVKATCLHVRVRQEVKHDFTTESGIQTSKMDQQVALAVAPIEAVKRPETCVFDLLCAFVAVTKD